MAPSCTQIFLNERNLSYPSVKQILSARPLCAGYIFLYFNKTIKNKLIEVMINQMPYKIEVCNKRVCCNVHLMKYLLLSYRQIV